MSNKFLKFLVIFLAILIVVCLAFLLYGLYLKISNTQAQSNDKIIKYSLNLNKTEKIDEVKVIDEKNLLVVVSEDSKIYLIVYNLKENKIVSKIER